MVGRFSPPRVCTGKLNPKRAREEPHFFLDTKQQNISFKKDKLSKNIKYPFLKALEQMKKRSDTVPAQQRLDQMLAKLRDRDFRITPQRLAVLKVLAASDGHPSVERIYDTVRAQFPTTSIATIYKTVALLKQENEVLEISFPDGSNRYDGNKPYPHPHLICTRCKKIVDPDLSSLEDLAKEVTEETGFQITTHRIDFFGLCRECR
jgi:Fur family transcriptional regulator, peroxide stress response regulator